MPRIKLKEQNQYKFEYHTVISVRDLNYGGHLGNDALVGIIHVARLDLLKKLKCDELNLGDGKTSIIMGDLAVNYLNQGFLHDKISIFSHISEIRNSGFRIFHKFIKKNDNPAGTESKALALAETGIVTFDYKKNKVTGIPDSFLTSLRRYNKSN